MHPGSLEEIAEFNPMLYQCFLKTLDVQLLGLSIVEANLQLQFTARNLIQVSHINLFNISRRKRRVAVEMKVHRTI